MEAKGKLTDYPLRHFEMRRESLDRIRGSFR